VPLFIQVDRHHVILFAVIPTPRGPFHRQRTHSAYVETKRVDFRGLIRGENIEHPEWCQGGKVWRKSLHFFDPATSARIPPPLVATSSPRPGARGERQSGIPRGAVPNLEGWFRGSRHSTLGRGGQESRESGAGKPTVPAPTTGCAARRGRGTFGVPPHSRCINHLTTVRARGIVFGIVAVRILRRCNGTIRRECDLTTFGTSVCVCLFVSRRAGGPTCPNKQ
jgi:hypothetical protein